MTDSDARMFLILLTEAIEDEARQEQWSRDRDRFHDAQAAHHRKDGLERAKRLWVSFMDRKQPTFREIEEGVA